MRTCAQQFYRKRGQEGRYHSAFVSKKRSSPLCTVLHARYSRRSHGAAHSRPGVNFHQAPESFARPRGRGGGAYMEATPSGAAAAGVPSDAAPAPAPDLSAPLEGARPDSIKIILLGDSAVGKSKLVERFLMDGYQPTQLSTYALTLFQYDAHIDGQKVPVDFWDTAGQERFQSLHPSYYHQAHACILVRARARRCSLFDVLPRRAPRSNLSLFSRRVSPSHLCAALPQAFDVTRKATYKNLSVWFKELQEYRKGIPTLVVANKIDCALPSLLACLARPNNYARTNCRDCRSG